MYMQQKEAIYYLASKKFTWLVDSFIYRSPWQVSQKDSLQPWTLGCSCFFPGVGARPGEAEEDEGADADGVAGLDGGAGVGDLDDGLECLTLDGGAGVGDLDDGAGVVDLNKSDGLGLSVTPKPCTPGSRAGQNCGRGSGSVSACSSVCQPFGYNVAGDTGCVHIHDDLHRQLSAQPLTLSCWMIVESTETVHLTHRVPCPHCQNLMYFVHVVNTFNNIRKGKYACFMKMFIQHFKSFRKIKGSKNIPLP